MSRPVARRNEAGFSLVVAIFVLVVLGTLGGFIVTIGMQQRTTVSYAVQGARAYYAALSGIEWGVYQAVRNGACSGVPVQFNPAAAGLQGFVVTVNCQASAHNESGVDYNVYTLEARAAFGAYGDPYYFTRSVRASVTDALAP